MNCRALLAGLASVLAVGCSTVNPRVYADQTPALELPSFFSGSVEGHGAVTDRSGQVTRRFVVTISASWSGDDGVLDESFAWSDGTRERRVWQLTRGSEPGTWRGTAADVVGEARGQVSGNALNWRYTLAHRTPDGDVVELDFDDWMFLVDEHVMLNRASMSFWGLHVGEVLISFRRV